MSRVLKLAKKVVLCLITSSILFTSWHPAASEHNHEIKPAAIPIQKGVKPLSPEDRNWMNQNMVRIEKVQPNKIGLERVNTERKKKGLHEININKAAPIGKDVIIEKTPPIVNLYAKAAPTSVADSVYTEEASYEQSELQPFVDNSTLPYFPPIRHQGSIGSCTSFSTAYYQATHMIAMANNWNTKDPNDNSNKFSPKWAYNLTNDGRDNGTSQVNTYRLFMEQGIATWSDFPYDDNYLEWPTNTETWKNALMYKPDRVGYMQIWDGSDTPVKDPYDNTLKNIKQLLSNGYVLSFNTVISDWVYKPIIDNPNSLNDDILAGRAACYMRDSSMPGDLGHAMTIVGYCDDVWVDINNNSQIDSGELGAFKIANSWGSNWGIDPYTQKNSTGDGFIWLCYDALNKVSSVRGIRHTASRCMAIDEYNTVFWMTVKTPEPPSLLACIRINHSKRNQLKYELGYSDAGKSTPDVVWTPYILNRDNGEFSFDGTEEFGAGTVVLDFSNLIINNNTSKTGLKWYIRITDKIADGNKGLVESVELVDLASGSVIQCPVRAGRVINGTSITVTSSYQFDSITSSQNSSDTYWAFKNTIEHNISHDGQNLVESGGRIYLYCTDRENSTSGMLLEYNPLLDNWTVYDKDFSLNTTKSKAVSTNGKIYFFMPGYIDIYDIASKQRTFAEMPETINNPAITVCNNKIYLAGGINSNGLFSSSILEYNPDSGSFRKFPDIMLHSRVNAAAVALGGKIFILGGNNENGAPVKEVEEFDPASETIIQVGSLPESILASNKMNLTAEVSNGKMYLFASEYNISYVYEYEPGSNWTNITTIPGKPVKTGVVSVNDLIYILPCESKNVLEFSPSTVQLFHDNFESGTLDEGDWISSGNSYIVNTNYSGNYSLYIEQDGSVEKALDLTGYKNAKITFSYNLNVFPETDALSLEWFDGFVWEPLEDITYANGSLINKHIELPEQANNNPNFRIRLFTKFDDCFDQVFIDDFEIKAVRMSENQSQPN